MSNPDINNISNLQSRPWSAVLRARPDKLGAGQMFVIPRAPHLWCLLLYWDKWFTFMLQLTLVAEHSRQLEQQVKEESPDVKEDIWRGGEEDESHSGLALQWVPGQAGPGPGPRPESESYLRDRRLHRHQTQEGAGGQRKTGPKVSSVKVVKKWTNKLKFDHKILWVQSSRNRPSNHKLLPPLTNWHILCEQQFWFVVCGI